MRSIRIIIKVYMQFKIFTRCIITNESWDILLTQKNDDQKISPWSRMLPGGTVEYWEDVEPCLVREIKEETNLDVTSSTLLCQNKIMIWDTHRLGLYYICEVWDISLLTNTEPEKHNFCGFVSKDQLPDMLDMDVIEKFLCASVT